MGDGLVDGQAHCNGTNAAGNVGSDLSTLAWDQLSLEHALSFRLESGEAVRKLITQEKARRLPLLTGAELGKLLAYAERNDNPADRALIIAERRRREPKAKPIKVKRYATGEAVVRAHAARSALTSPTQEFDGEARDGFGGSQRSLVDGASFAAELAHKAASGDWRKRPAIVADRARADRPAGYPYNLSTDFCIALAAWGRECGKLATAPRFAKAKGYGHV